ncbi:unnamed protein product [Cuscuta campestris]|uniref:Phosphoribosyltransferase domain-containing protein n=1 Tax=Cuscuta campestris TaxID=132261 RepID=A0A484K2T6_9ASTE|nr:unnamed protein product [Cuscuta campestris]
MYILISLIKYNSHIMTYSYTMTFYVSGNSAIKAISVLISKGVEESNIIFLNLISAPQGLREVCERFPRVKIVTLEIDRSLNKDLHVIPGMGDFGDRYFGTVNATVTNDNPKS